MTTKTKARFWSRSALAALAGVCAVVAVADVASAQRRGREEEEASENRVVGREVGELIVKAQEALTAGSSAAAIPLLSNALTKAETPYERGIVLQLRGQAYYDIDQPQNTLKDFEEALRVGDLNAKERLNLQYNIGQLQLSQGNYARAVELLEAWIRAGGQASAAIHLNMVAAYSELGQLSRALPHGKAAFDKANPKERKHFDVLNYLYTELNMPRERAALLQQMVALFPGDKKVWLSIAALYAQGGQEQKAYEINKIMYLNGMYTTEAEIMRVVDYTSYLDVPFRGAQIMEREMNRGRVAKNLKNYEKLARLYRQGREFDLAIPALTQAAKLSGNGKLYQQLGEANYAENKLEAAETALRSALSKGVERPGNVWVLIGNTRYERGDRQAAVEAFKKGLDYNYAKKTASGWIEFIEGEIAVEEANLQFQREVIWDEYRVRCERRRAAGTSILDTGEEVTFDCPAILKGDYSSIELPEELRPKEVAALNDDDIVVAEPVPEGEDELEDEAPAAPDLGDVDLVEGEAPSVDAGEIKPDGE